MNTRRDELVNNQPIRCYDAGEGSSAARYSVLYMNLPEGRGLVGGREMSDDPFHGIGSWAPGEPGPHLGRRIPFSELPEACRRLVEQDTRPASI